MVVTFIAFYTDTSHYQFEIWMPENWTLVDVWKKAVEQAISERPFRECLTKVCIVKSRIASGD